MRLRSLAGLALHNLAGNELRGWLLGLCALCIAAFAVATVLVVHGAQESLHLAADRLGADVVVVPRGAETQVDGALLMGTVSRTWMPSCRRRPDRRHSWRGRRLSSGLPGVALARLLLCRQPHVHRRLRSADRLHH